jgi:protein phosphatase
VATAPLSGKTPPHQVAIAMPHRGLIAIADGGRATVAGGSAARMAAQTLVQVFESTATLTPLRMRGLPALLGAIQRANREMQEATKRDPKLKTMQASLAAVLSAGGHVAIARVGTASVYRVRGGEIERMVEAAGDAAQGKASERLGAEKTVEVETSIQPAEPGDLYLVCTSGGRSVAGTDLADFVTPGKPGEAEPDLDAALGSLSRARQDLSPWAGAVLQLASTPGACA